MSSRRQEALDAGGRRNAGGHRAYKLLASLGEAQAIGPILVGMDRQVHVLQRLSEAPDIVNMAVIAAVDALEHRRHARST